MYRIALSFLIVLLLGSCATNKKRPVLRSPDVKSSSGASTSVILADKSSDKASGVSQTNRARGTSVAGIDYIEQYKDVAIREMNQYGIPASVKLAQALLESGNGTSYLAKEAKNHFGIKCGGVWAGPSVARDDDNPNDCFRVYSSVDDSYRDHSQFLLRKRYEKLFHLKKDDYKGWAVGLKEAGYATNPRYPELLIDIIERYQLHQYDKGESKAHQKHREQRLERIIEEKAVLETPAKADQIKTPLGMVIHEVRSGQTLYSISKLYGVTVMQLKEINSIGDDSIAVGQLIVISK